MPLHELRHSFVHGILRPMGSNDELEQLGNAELRALVRELMGTLSQAKVTPSSEQSELMRTLALRCTNDVEIVAEAMVFLGDQLDDERGRVVGGLMRCYSARIKQLNTGLMNYLGGASVVEDLKNALYGELPRRTS